MSLDICNFLRDVEEEESRRPGIDPWGIFFVNEAHRVFNWLKARNHGLGEGD